MFVLRLGLGAVPAVLEDVIGGIGHRLDAYRPRLSEGETGFELSLTIIASDLWVAVLLAMAAVTDMGYTAVSLQAWPIEPNTEQSGCRHRIGSDCRR